MPAAPTHGDSQKVSQDIPEYPLRSKTTPSWSSMTANWVFVNEKFYWLWDVRIEVSDLDLEAENLGLNPGSSPNCH